MSLAAALILAAATASAPAPASERSGVQLVTAQVSAVILEPVIVRQASGPEPSPGGPAPQITRREGTVLVEFQ